MSHIALWLVDWLFATLLILGAGAVAVALCRHVALRERIAELSLAAAVLAAIPAAVPSTHRLSLGLLPAPERPHAKVHIGLLPWKSSAAGVVRQPPAHPTNQIQRQHKVSSGVLGIVASWQVWLPLLYGAGVAFMLGRLFVGWWLLQRIRKNGRRVHLPLPRQIQSHLMREQVDIFTSQMVATPLAAGWFRPMILLPEGFDGRSEAVAVVAHELAHIDRRDIRWRYLISFAQAIVFINPLANYLAGQARLAQEILADRLAAEAGPGPAAYASILLSLVKSTPPGNQVTWATTFMLGGRSEMLRRLEHIAEGKPIGPATLGRPLLLGLLATATLACAAASAITLQNPQAGRSTGPIGSRGSEASRRAAKLMRISALQYLARRQRPDGAWLGRYGPAVTALVVRAFLRAGESPSLPQIRRGLHFIESCRQPDGGYYRLDEPAYNTAIVVRTLSMLHGRKYARRCAQAIAFLRSINAPPSANADAIRRWYDGHSSRGRNVADNASATAGAMAVALAPDFGNLDPHERPGDMRLRSYGSITYSQLKSMIYANLSPRDPRVARLSHWLRAEKQIQNNPAAHGSQGLLYFCLVYARVMHAMEKTHRVSIISLWRVPLVHLMQSLRRPGGYWKNTYSGQWLEGNRIMATTYAALIFDNVLAH